MDTIQLSVEELIFSFYSEGMYEQGISIKETYFPNLQDSELKLLLEFAARSLLAKNMVHEVNNQYKLIDKYTPYIHILCYAEKTVKASKFNSAVEGEESISFHYRNGEVYCHRLIHDHQVHRISKYSDRLVSSSLNEFFCFQNINKESEILFILNAEEFEELLKDMSKPDPLSDLIVQKWKDRVQGAFPIEFLKDISKRKGRMDSLLSLRYDSENNPELVDINFVIPGKSESWLITRDNSLNLNIQRANTALINNLLFNNKAFSI